MHRIRYISALGVAALVPFVAIVAFVGQRGSAPEAGPGHKTTPVVRQPAGWTARRAVTLAVKHPAAPSAAQFARVLAGVSNEYARAHDDATRIDRVHCVPGAPGDYMCSYRLLRPRRPAECHLLQARWTPGQASSFHVILAGRARACGSVREAVVSLR